MLTSAFGASIAASIATAKGCGGISSGMTRTGVWQLRTKSRGHGEHEIGVGAVQPEQKLVDHLHGDLGPALDQIRTPAGHAAGVEEGRHLGTETDRLRRHRGDDTTQGARLSRFQMNGPPMQKPSTMNLSTPR